MDESHVGQSLLTVLQQPFREETATLLRDRTAGENDDPVLVCGTVVSNKGKDGGKKDIQQTKHMTFRCQLLKRMVKSRLHLYG